MAVTLPGHRPQWSRPPGRGDLDDGRHDQQAADRTGGAGQVPEQAAHHQLPRRMVMKNATARRTSSASE